MHSGSWRCLHSRYTHNFIISTQLLIIIISFTSYRPLEILNSSFFWSRYCLEYLLVIHWFAQPQVSVHVLHHSTGPVTNLTLLLGYYYGLTSEDFWPPAVTVGALGGSVFTKVLTFLLVKTILITKLVHVHTCLACTLTWLKVSAKDVFGEACWFHRIWYLVYITASWKFLVTCASSCMCVL